MKITSEDAMITYTKTPSPSIQYIPVAMTGQQSLMAFHRHLLDDTVRTTSFIKAIEAVVKEGDVVVDLGTGSGILAMACARAGARKVYAIESADIIHGAMQVARANGMADTIVFLHNESSRVTLPEPADVIVSECIGLMGPGEMMGAVVDLASRALKPEGRIIPGEVSLFLAPVESSLHYDYVNVWRKERYYGFDFSPLHRIASNNVYVAWFQEESFLSPPQEIATLRLMRDDVKQVDRSLSFELTRGGLLHGFCGWFDIELGGGVRLSAAPSAPPTIWKQIFLPLEEPVPVREKTRVTLDFGIRTNVLLDKIPGHFRWSTTVEHPGGEQEITFKQSTVKSTART